MLQELRNFRQKSYDLKSAISGLKMKSRELSLAYTAFEKSQMWCGNAIGYLPDAPEYPYKESIDPSTGDKIAPISDIMDKEPNESSGSLIQDIKYLRRIAKEALDNFDIQDKKVQLGTFTAEDQESLTESFSQIFVNFREGINWLGAELGRIKDEESKTDNTEGN